MDNENPTKKAFLEKYQILKNMVYEPKKIRNFISEEFNKYLQFYNSRVI